MRPKCNFAQNDVIQETLKQINDLSLYEYQFQRLMASQELLWSLHLPHRVYETRQLDDGFPKN